MSELQTYINMNAKAIEVQKLHKPAVCDRYVCACEACRKREAIYYVHDYDIDHLNKRDLTNVYEPYAKMVREADTCTFIAYYNDRRDEDLSYIWLPTQAQLQDIVKDLEGSDAALVKYFDHWLFLMRNRAWKVEWTMEQLWLAFVMYKNFNKIWDGEEWILR